MHRAMPRSRRCGDWDHAGFIALFTLLRIACSVNGAMEFVWFCFLRRCGGRVARRIAVCVKRVKQTLRRICAVY